MPRRPAARGETQARTTGQMPADQGHLEAPTRKWNSNYAEPAPWHPRVARHRRVQRQSGTEHR
eukprot:1940266-Pyramimonas_sp.AAC.1